MKMALGLLCVLASVLSFTVDQPELVAHRLSLDEQEALAGRAGEMPNDRICFNLACNGVGAGTCRTCTGSQTVGRCATKPGQDCEVPGGTICGNIEQCGVKWKHLQNCTFTPDGCNNHCTTTQTGCDTGDC